MATATGDLPNIAVDVAESGDGKDDNAVENIQVDHPNGPTSGENSSTSIGEIPPKEFASIRQPIERRVIKILDEFIRVIYESVNEKEIKVNQYLLLTFLFLFVTSKDKFNEKLKSIEKYIDKRFEFSKFLQ